MDKSNGLPVQNGIDADVKDFRYVHSWLLINQLIVNQCWVSSQALTPPPAVPWWGELRGKVGTGLRWAHFNGKGETGHGREAKAAIHPALAKGRCSAIPFPGKLGGEFPLHWE